MTNLTDETNVTVYLCAVCIPIKTQCQLVAGHVKYSVFSTSSIWINADILLLETQQGKENAFVFLGERVCEHQLNITRNI